MNEQLSVKHTESDSHASNTRAINSYFTCNELCGVKRKVFLTKVECHDILSRSFDDFD